MPETPYIVTREYWCRKCHPECTGHAKVNAFETAQDARGFRSSVLRTMAAWMPREAVHAEVGEIAGPGLAADLQSPDAWKRGMELCREAIANAKGPLFQGSRVTGTPSSRRSFDHRHYTEVLANSDAEELF